MFGIFVVGAVAGSVLTRAIARFFEPARHQNSLAPPLPPPPPPPLPPSMEMCPKTLGINIPALADFEYRASSAPEARGPHLGLRLSAIQRAATALRKAPPPMTVDQKRAIMFSQKPPLFAELKAVTDVRTKNDEN